MPMIFAASVGVVPSLIIFRGGRSGSIDRDKTICHPAADILCDLLPKIPIERRDTAGKATSIMHVPQGFNDMRSGHRDATITLRRRAMARSIAGASGGGLRIASTNAR